MASSKKKYLLKILLVSSIVLFIVLCIFCCKPVKASTTDNYYPTLLQVVYVNYDPNTDTGYAVLSLNNYIIDGYKYITTNPAYIWDMWVGDFYAAIMYSNGTQHIMDDTIVSLHYVRPDLF